MPEPIDHNAGLREPLAIIGLATRFPQDASSTEDFWKFLLRGKSAYTPFPPDRIGQGHYHPDPEHGGTHAVQGGHFLAEDPAYFDAPFFGITKGEAMVIDPQQRLVLENVYHALESAGYSLDKVSGSNTSVYVSGFNHDFLSIQNSDPEMLSRFKATGMTNSMLSNRLSWFLNAQGPSMTIDTACSSSMVALHLGCQSLRTGESDMAIASGVTVISYPGDITNMSHQGFLGQAGKCFSFDSRAAGYARGEGVGTVIVKRLSDAVRDGDTIRSIIRATAVNQDGKTPGLTLPDSGAQEALIADAYAKARLPCSATAMVEAHGTGTPVGDPIEANALARAFSSRPKNMPLIVGAGKSGTGHLEGAAGVAGIIKATLILESGIIPPNCNFEHVNPKIPAKKWNLAFPTPAIPWPSDRARRISVNAFGVGGTNAHTIMDDAYHYLAEHDIIARHLTASHVPSQHQIDNIIQQIERKGFDKADTNGDVTSNGTGNDSGLNGTANTQGEESNGVHPTDNIINESNPDETADAPAGESNRHDGLGVSVEMKQPPKIVVLSAFDEEGVKRNAEAQKVFWEAQSDPPRPKSGIDLEAYAYTLWRRSQLSWRSYVLADSREDLLYSFSCLPTKPVRARARLNLAFVFTGQGAGWYAMGRELWCYSPFRRSLQQADKYISQLGAEWSLLQELAKGKAESKMDEAYISQPACTALQIALIDLLDSWKIRPSRVIGHSSGEIAAAFCAGKLSRESAYRVAYFRGVVSSQSTSSPGAMLAVGLSQEKLKPYLDTSRGAEKGELVIACINSPRNCTVSGDSHLIDLLRQALDLDGHFARKLNVSNAYHSSHMLELAGAYSDLLGELPAPQQLRSGNVQMFSTVTGSHIDADLLAPQYWVANLTSPVRFSDTLVELCFSRLQQKQASLRAGATTANVFADVLIELGPHGALQSAIKETVLGRPEGTAISSLTVLNRSSPGPQTLLGTIGQLWCKGFRVDVQGVNESLKSDRELEKSSNIIPNVPGYVFNHSNRFWQESRLSRNYRLRVQRRHDLLGAPVPDWSRSAPKWRHFLRISEQPWLRDHVVTNAIVYPGVGYLIAAIEAARQVADPSLSLRGFRLRDISLKRALVVPDNKDGVETMFALSPQDESSISASTLWQRFQMSSYSANAEDWIEHCAGYIATDYETDPGPIDNGRESQEELKLSSEALAQAERRCTEPFDIVQIYENLVTSGLAFGPLFRNVSSVTGTSTRDGQVLGTVTVADVAKSMPKGHLSEHLMHPATMDSMMHFALAAILDSTGRTNLESPTVPTFIKDVWISAGLTSQPGHEYLAHGQTRMVAFQKYESIVSVWDKESAIPRITLKGIRATPLDSVALGSIASRKLCYELNWTPYLETVHAATLEQSLDAQTTDPEALKYWNTRLQLASVTMIVDALNELEDLQLQDLPIHLSRYLDWMKQIRTWLFDDNLSVLRKANWEALQNKPKDKEVLYDLVANYNANGKLAVRMGRSIVPILQGNEDALHLMFGMDDILDQVYAQVAFLNELPSLQREYLSLIGQNRTNLRILEVGAGTGSSTVSILEALASGAETGIRESVAGYTYTDISSAFFDKARDKFQAYGNLIEYKVFDAEKDPEEQGYELASYDLVVAQNVIHATKSVKHTLTNISKLLRPGGRLLLQEGVRQDYFWSGIAFGLLPGWWLGVEPERKWSPWISSQQWDDTLRSSGFQGVELELRDSRDTELHTQSLFVTKVATTTESRHTLPDIAIITASTTDTATSQVAWALKARLEEGREQKKVSVMQLADVARLQLSGTICVCIAEIEKPLLESLSREQYEDIRRMLVECKGLFWVTGDNTLEPARNMITGLLRSVRWERDLDDANLVLLALASPETDLSGVHHPIAELFEQQHLALLPRDQYHGEYKYQDGQYFTSRLQRAGPADSFLTSSFNRLAPVPTKMGDAGRPIKLSSAAPGILSSLEWVTDEAYNEPLGETEVEIEIKAVGLNFRDLMIAMGEHMAYSIGSEGAGVISRVGTRVTDLQIGDRVVYIPGLENVATFHTFGRIDQQTVVKLPDALSFEIAAGLPVVCTTVIYGLRDVGRLAKNEKILIHAAAGGVGQAAIRYAKHVGAEIFATVSSLPKRELLVNEFGIAGDHIFSSRDLTFVQGILRMTDGRGVDVVLNSLSGEALRRSWDLLAPFGRFIEIGKKDAQQNGRIELRPYLQNMTMASVDLITMMKYRPLLLKQLIEDTVQLWTQGVIRAAEPTKIMPMSQAVEAFQILQTGKGMGKIVLVPHFEDVVPIVPAKPEAYRFRSNATYVLSGGLGGIGRSLAKWMASRGARHFLFLSSSGKITDAVSHMQSELEDYGCIVVIRKCDVSDKETLRTVLRECETTLPPIKGVIQGAMKLSDCMFENMDYATFELATRPKVQGSWNLHELLPGDLDHFVMLSSATGILGNRSQGNYAAGNTFQDALAYHRRSLGLAASTLDLGTVLSVGYVAENLERVAMAKHINTVLEVIREDEIRALLEYLIDPRHHAPAQLVSGLTTLETYRSRGAPAPTYLDYPLFTHLRSTSSLLTLGSGSDGAPVVSAQLAAARTFSEAATIVTTAIVAKLASLLSIAVEDINSDRSVSANSVDSLVAMEFRTFLAREVKAEVPILDIMGTMSIKELSKKIAAQSSVVEVKEGGES